MDLKKFIDDGRDAQTGVNAILSEAEVAMIRRGNTAPAIDQEKVGRMIARADYEERLAKAFEGVPSAQASPAELVAAIDKAAATLRQYPNSPDLQYCVGYLEGFRELIAPPAASDDHANDQR